MEYFDICTQSGTPTGRTALRGSPLADGEYYVGVHVYLQNAEGMFLIQQRSLSKSFRPGKWDILMGHVLAGETCTETILREVWEEVGLSIPQNSIAHLGKTIWTEEHHIIHAYLVQTNFSLADVAFNDDEVMDAGLITLDDMISRIEATSRLPESHRRMVCAALRALPH